MRGAEVGEWDRAIREVTVAREESSDELETNYLSWGLITFAAWRGDDVTSELARLTAWAESIGESGAADAVHDLRARVDSAAGRFRAACTEWMAFAPSDPLNAPTAYFYAGLAGLMAVDRDRAAAALAGLQGTPGRGRVRVIDRRLLGAGLAALDGREQDALREARAVIGDPCGSRVRPRDPCPIGGKALPGAARRGAGAAAGSGRASSHALQHRPRDSTVRPA